MIEPNSQAALVSGATTLNRPRSWPLTIEVIEVRPRTAVPAAAARAALWPRRPSPAREREEARRGAHERDDEERQREVAGHADDPVARVALGVDDLRDAAGGERGAGEDRRTACELVCD